MLDALGFDLPPVFFHVLAAARSASLYDIPFDLPLAYTAFTCAIQLEAGIVLSMGFFRVHTIFRGSNGTHPGVI